MDEHFPFLSLLLITGMALFVPLLASHLQKRHIYVPIVVGEILAGMLVGRSGFNLIEGSPILDFLATFGFTYLMFLSGLEVDFSTILIPKSKSSPKNGNPLNLGLSVFALTLIGGFLAAFGLSKLGLVHNPIIIALILSTTSLGIVVPVLKERGLTGSSFGQSVLVAALVADFATLLLISIVVTVLSRGVTFDLLLIFLLLGTFVMMARIGQQAAGIAALKRLIDELSQATAQIRVRGAFALMVAFIVLAEGLGIEIILGAFLAGAIVSLLSEREGSYLHMKMDAIGYGFFVPIFFIMVGVRFDLPALLESRGALLLVPLLIVAAYGIKFAASLPFRFLYSWRETLAAGALLSSRLSLIIAAAAIALEIGVIGQAINSAIVLVAIVTCTLSPVLFNRLLPPLPSPTRRGIILAGLGELSALLANRLRQEGEEVTLIGRDKERVEEIKRRGLTVIEASPDDPAQLEIAGAKSAAVIVALTVRDDVNLQACRLAKDVFGVPATIALASDPAIARQMNELGIRVVQPQTATILALEGALHFPAAFDMLADRADGVEIRETTLVNPRLDGVPLRRVRLPGEALVVGLRRSGDVLVPHGDTVLRLQDVLMLVGHPDALQEAQTCLNPPQT